MSARDGMATLITRLRRLVDDAGSTTWTDDQLQTVLDEQRRDVWRERLACQTTVTGGTTLYQDFYSRHNNFEGTTGGSAIFTIEDDNGDVIGTADWTPDYARGYIYFPVSQAGSARWLTGRSYGLNPAAADLWRERAAKVSSQYSFSADGHSLSRSDYFLHCLRMADHYASQEGAVTAVIIRDDLVV